MGLLGFADIEELTGVPKNTLYKWKERGKLPVPDVTRGERVFLWEEKTILEWLDRGGTDDRRFGAGS